MNQLDLTERRLINAKMADGALKSRQTQISVEFNLFLFCLW